MYTGGRVLARNNWASALLASGDTDAPLELAAEAIAILEFQPNPRLEVTALLTLSEVYVEWQEMDLALEAARSAYAAAVATTERTAILDCFVQLAVLDRIRGQLGTAAEDLREASGVLDGLGWGGGILSVKYHLALAELWLSAEEPRSAAGPIAVVTRLLAGSTAHVRRCQLMVCKVYAAFLGAGLAAAHAEMEPLQLAVAELEHPNCLARTARSMWRLGQALQGGMYEQFWVGLCGGMVPLRVIARVGAVQRRSDDPPPSVATDRDRVLLVALSDGLPRTAVAARLGRSESTVAKMVSRLYSVTGFGSQYQLVAWARRSGII
jgi:DNA-binding CsgD family transcriptional regulator